MTSLPTRDTVVRFTADRIISRDASPEYRAIIERSVRNEVIRAAKEQGYYLPDGIEVFEVTQIVPADPKNPPPKDMIGVRARAVGVIRPESG